MLNSKSRRAFISIPSMVGSKRYSTDRDAPGVTAPEFTTLLLEAGFEKYRGLQAYRFVHYEKGDDWNKAICLPKDIRKWLEHNISIDHGSLVTNQSSKDGTRKYLIKVGEGRSVETVLIPENERATLCISSQMGCSLQCRFCHTGTQKLEGNLTSSEILRQYFALPIGIRKLVTNFVFMGQGEPLYNFKNLAKAVEIITDQKALAFGHGKVTISTSGIAPLIPKVASELGVNLAISLHAPNDSIRSQIMPINNTYPLNVLMEACHGFVNKASCATRRISFEYVMLKNINDQPQHATELAKLIRYLPSHVNLIPFNPWPGTQFKSSSMDVIDAFVGVLEDRGIPTTVRRTRGKDIMAACGQLKSSENNKMKLDP